MRLPGTFAWRLAASLMVLVGLAGVPARAVVVSAGGDNTTTPVVNSLRWAITEINANNQSPPIDIQVANISLAGGLPAINGGKNCNVNIFQDTTINANNNSVFTGDFHSFNATGDFQLTINSGNPAISTSPGAGVTLNRLRFGGTGGASIVISNGGQSVTIQDVVTTGDKGGYGIDVTCSSATLRGITIQDHASGGIRVDASTNVTFQTLAPGTFAAGTVPAFRQHNFVGFSDTYADGASGRSSIGGTGVELSFGNNCTVTDLDVGNCNGMGINIDPAGGITALTLRRIHVGSMPNGTVKPVTGDGLRVQGGRCDATIGNAADATPGAAAPPTYLGTINFTDDNPAGAYLHPLGDLGLTVGAARGGTGIRLGLGDDAMNGQVTLRYARSGVSVDGMREATEGISIDDPARRRQDTGLFCNVTGGPLTIDNCQMTGNLNRGAFLQGSARLTFTNNNIGLRADTTTVPYTSAERLAVGNGTRTYHEGTDYPASVTGGEGLRLDMSGLLLSFMGNVISGNAQDGVIITNLCPGTAAPPIGTGGVGDGTAANWNHIGTQGRGLEAGRAAYLGAVPAANPTVGLKLVNADDPLTVPNENQVASDNATGYYGGQMGTPRVRGNGTTVFSSGSGAGNQAFGSGFTYQGTGPLVVRGITVSDNAVDGFVIDTPQNDLDASVQLTQARIGVDDTGVTITDQSIGNGTICRGAPTGAPYSTIVRRQGAGIRVNGDGQNALGIGSDIPNVTGLSTLDRNVISSNLVYGVQVTGNVGTTDPLATSLAISASRIGTNLTGDSAGTVNPIEGRLGFGNGHIMADPTSPAFATSYPAYYGAGVRFEPNSKGRHLVGGDDTINAAANDDIPPDLPDATMSERNVICNNGLVGVWLRGEGSVCVAANYIGLRSDGTAVPTGRDEMIQLYGVLVEQPEFSLHNVTSAPAGTNPMQPQYIGAIPFSGLTNENTDPSTQGGGPSPHYYGNVIVDHGLWGVAIEDNGDHMVVDNFIGTDKTGTVSLGNGRTGLPMALSITLFPQSQIVSGGVEIGALNQLIASGKT